MKKYRGIYSIATWLIIISVVADNYFILLGLVFVSFFLISKKYLFELNMFIDDVNNFVKDVIFGILLGVVFYFMFFPLKFLRYFLNGNKKNKKNIKFTINRVCFLNPW
ncbi:hypothetical protein EC396_13320 [Lutibacter sp. HS1-25]|uniref:hypothetical protein n=1 Tax=Lutibacter sp. HS1-25 TaxID=2485000 RepID=UPI001012FA76|nr:hypothetical protein [Lutibacter sp. HS1-25]RXP46855.1 hypothetical protein EC396_13320 [Lutibacter sp. HS1-25]